MNYKSKGEPMKKQKTTYKSMPDWGQLDQMNQVEDFLPKPEDLITKQNTKKVTLILSEDSIEFFKEQAAKHNSSYQPMIRNLLDEYTRRMRYS